MPFDLKPPFGSPPDRASDGAVLPLTLDCVSVRRGGRFLLRDVSLRLNAGRRTVVMGPNGAGKSVLLRVLKGLVEATSGTILSAGRPLDSARRRRIGLVLQRPVLLRRSVRGNLDHALRACGVPSAKRRPRIADLLALAGLAAHADRPARLLSGGEQQRLSIVRALASEPEALLLDEPTNNLDPHATQCVEALIAQTAASGVKIVCVTHDIGQARRLADDVVFLHKGCVEEQATADAFFDQPTSSAAADYLAGRLCL